MALEREHVPRGMQLSLNCTLLAATELTQEKWEGILSEATMKLVQLAHDHYTHQLEVENAIQGQNLSTINECKTLKVQNLNSPKMRKLLSKK